MKRSLPIRSALLLMVGAWLTKPCLAQDPAITFTSLEDALRTPEAVHRLDLSDASLGRFPLDVLRLPNLEYLSLRNDGITELPDAIGGLQRLKVLDLSGNPIARLPEGFTGLRSLEELFLNEDHAFSAEADLDRLARLPNLRVLHLERDGLNLLPGNVAKLRALEELYLNGNGLRELPPEILGAKRLRVLDVTANPIDLTIPLELQGRGVLVRF